MDARCYITFIFILFFIRVIFSVLQQIKNIHVDKVKCLAVTMLLGFLGGIGQCLEWVTTIVSGINTLTGCMIIT